MSEFIMFVLPSFCSLCNKAVADDLTMKIRFFRALYTTRINMQKNSVN